MKLKSFLIAVVLLSTLTTGAPGLAQTKLSIGCDYINGASWPITASRIQLFLEFAEKERIIASTTSNLSTGTPIPTQTQLYIDDVLVDKDDFPGVVAYRFLADGARNVSWEVDPGNALWTIRCLANQPSATVPTLGWKGVALLASLLAGIACFRLAGNYWSRRGASGH